MELLDNSPTYEVQRKGRFQRGIRAMGHSIPALYLTDLFCGDLYFLTKDHILLFFLWAVPALYLTVNLLELTTMLTGLLRRPLTKFSVIKTMPPGKFIPDNFRFERFFLSIEINSRTRIISGIFRTLPSSIMSYRDLSYKLKIVNAFSLLSKLLWIACLTGVLGLFKIAIQFVIK